MSSVGSISGSGLDITQLLQRLASQSGVEGTNSVGSLKPPGEPSEEQRAEFESIFAEALKAVGVSDDEVATIQDEIKSAISDAMQNQDSSTNPRDVMKSVIDETLQKHGIDPEEVRSQLAPPEGGYPPPPNDVGINVGSDGTQTDDGLLSQLLSSGNSDNSVYQLLQSLLPLLDETA